MAVAQPCVSDPHAAFLSLSFLALLAPSLASHCLVLPDQTAGRGPAEPVRSLYRSRHRSRSLSVAFISPPRACRPTTRPRARDPKKKKGERPRRRRAAGQDRKRRRSRPHLPVRPPMRCARSSSPGISHPGPRLFPFGGAVGASGPPVRSFRSAVRASPSPPAIGPRRRARPGAHTSYRCSFSSRLPALCEPPSSPSRTGRTGSGDGAGAERKARPCAPSRRARCCRATCVVRSPDAARGCCDAAPPRGRRRPDRSCAGGCGGRRAAQRAASPAALFALPPPAAPLPRSTAHALPRPASPKDSGASIPARQKGSGRPPVGQGSLPLWRFTHVAQHPLQQRSRRQRTTPTGLLVQRLRADAAAAAFAWAAEERAHASRWRP